MGVTVLLGMEEELMVQKNSMTIQSILWNIITWLRILNIKKSFPVFKNTYQVTMNPIHLITNFQVKTKKR